MKQTVVFDFDGVIHSYTSGWKGETVIPDPPVSGIKEAIEEIRGAGYEVAVVSTRCASLDGLYAVEDYLRHHNIEVDAVQAEKPPAVVYIDDRALRFNGDAAGLLVQIQSFEPWYKRTAPSEVVTGLREKLVDLILRTPAVAVSSRTAAEHIADHLMENGVGVLR